jgi:Ion transport protein
VIGERLRENTQHKAKWNRFKCWKHGCFTKKRRHHRNKLLASRQAHESDVHLQEREDAGELQDYEIEYFVVNLQRSLNGASDRRQFMYLLSLVSLRDLSYLEIPLLQTIITFKWETYTRAYFMWQFYKCLLFILSLILDIALLNQAHYTMEGEPSSYLGVTIATRSACSLYILDHMLSECKQLYNQGVKQYVTASIWNVCDNILAALYIAYVPVSFTRDLSDYSLKVLQCLLLLLACIKLNYFLRIFDRFSYLVQMIIRVFFDLQHFIVFYVIIIAMFSIQVSLIMSDQSDEEGSDDKGIGPVKYFVSTLRTSLGDNDLDQADSPYKILFWAIWLMVMFVGNIVLMNFIIAVVGESYANCSETMLA